MYATRRRIRLAASMAVAPPGCHCVKELRFESCNLPALPAIWDFLQMDKRAIFSLGTRLVILWIVEHLVGIAMLLMEPAGRRLRLRLRVRLGSAPTPPPPPPDCNGKLQVSHCERPRVDCAHNLPDTRPAQPQILCVRKLSVPASVKDADSTQTLTDSCCPALFPLCSGAEDDMGTITNAPKRLLSCTHDSSCSNGYFASIVSASEYFDCSGGTVHQL